MGLISSMLAKTGKQGPTKSGLPKLINMFQLAAGFYTLPLFDYKSTTIRIIIKSKSTVLMPAPAGNTLI